MQEFAIRVPEAKIPNLMEILESVTPEQRSAKLVCCTALWSMHCEVWSKREQEPEELHWSLDGCDGFPRVATERCNKTVFVCVFKKW